MPLHYLYLMLAVAAETIGTSALQASAQFTRLWPSVLVVVAYAISFYLLSLTLKYMPVGIMYAMWSGLGIVFIALIGWLVFRQTLDLPAVIGITLILTGIAIIQLFSATTSH
ncbi:MAG: SMR family transporter [Salibaculum sp.]|jgi:small multidrug resistance pump|uniref:DMT family transporter n=1 Tax=Salibaculum sp. TaxID=2855480 RepID=UPI00287085C3|nr:SMR family transporter [Salibaculum sp.]MDR9427948.1 SMR family transporter [Salibaculum sp.]MDR9481521.1 SMR family transporter [Salibaculum sp.]